MNTLNFDEIHQYVTEHIGDFHRRRIESLKSLKLKDVLKRKNPYLFRAKHILTAHELISQIVDAHISSQEETIFGNWLEGLAIFNNQQVYSGHKSGITGIDLEFLHEGAHYVVTIKSGPNWGNSSQINKMRADFKTAQKTLRTSNHKTHVVAVNGCCYGKDANPDKGDYFKYYGQAFWAFISGDDTLYQKLIEPLGHGAGNKNEEFALEHAQALNRFELQFIQEFCGPEGAIDWPRLLAFNSGAG